MKTTKALPYTSKEKRNIFRLENSSCSVANIHELVFAKKHTLDPQDWLYVLPDAQIWNLSHPLLLLALGIKPRALNAQHVLFHVLHPQPLGQLWDPPLLTHPLKPLPKSPFQILPAINSSRLRLPGFRSLQSFLVLCFHFLCLIQPLFGSLSSTCFASTDGARSKGEAFTSCLAVCCLCDRGETTEWHRLYLQVTSAARLWQVIATQESGPSSIRSWFFKRNRSLDALLLKYGPRYYHNQYLIG
jgi:hypothetical protein